VPARLLEPGQSHLRMVVLPDGVGRISHHVGLGPRKRPLDIPGPNHDLMSETGEPTGQRLADHPRADDSDLHGVTMTLIESRSAIAR
jgi:hypothetical protein